MHTTSRPNSSFYFIHNGDCSGPVSFNATPEGADAPVEVACPFPVLAAAVLGVTSGPVRISVRGDGHSFVTPYTEVYYDVTIDAADIRYMIGERLRDELIAAAENASTDELLAEPHEKLTAWAAETPDWS